MPPVMIVVVAMIMVVMTIVMIRMIRMSVAPVVSVMPVFPPASPFQAPSASLVPPFRAIVDLAGAQMLPMASIPHISPAVPVPVAGRPYVSATRSRNGFIPDRRRASDDDADADLRRGLCRQVGGEAGGKQCRNGDVTFHAGSEMKRQ